MNVNVLVLGLLAVGFASAASAQEDCGGLSNAYGPFDYRTNRGKLDIVERFHFTPDIESLRGVTKYVAGDLDYTLRASPNHHRALIALTTLGRKLKVEQIPGAKYSVECYFDRAVRFAANDSVVRLIYGTYLARSGKSDEALKQLEFAQSLDNNNANVHYNLGLLYFEVKDYPKARLHAQQAYQRGIQLPGLRKMLEGAQQWQQAAPAEGQSQTAKGAAPSKDPK